MAQSGEPATGGLSALHLRLPQFWPADPQIWFAQVESQFATARITSQVQRFHHIIAALPPNIAAEIRDLVLTPPADSPYDTLKAELIRRTTSSEQRRLQQLLTSEELGDRKPTQLLRRLQQLLGEKAPTFDVALLRELFLQRLPTGVRMVLAAASGLNLEDLAKLVDSVMEVAVPTIAHVQNQSGISLPTTPSAEAVTAPCDVNNLREEFHKEIGRLSAQIAALTDRIPAGQRPRSSSRQRRPRHPSPSQGWYNPFTTRKAI
ncbi:uncharacterized protein ISCGN_003345 [Ixodes scapularis]